MCEFPILSNSTSMNQHSVLGWNTASLLLAAYIKQVWAFKGTQIFFHVDDFAFTRYLCVIGKVLCEHATT